MLDHIHLRLLAYHFVKLDPPAWRFSSLQSHFWRLYINDRAGASIEHAGQRYELEQERLYLIPAGVRFSTSLARSVGHLYIHFDLPGFPWQIQQENFTRPLCLPFRPALVETFRTVCQELEQNQSEMLVQIRLKAALYEALLLCLQQIPAAHLRQSTRQAELGEAIAPALHYIEAHLGASLSNRELADLCHMNTDYFIRCFRLGTRYTPVRYIQQQRVKRAEQQLLMTHLSLEQIAADCGFGSRSYFTRIFTRHTGVSPAAYRKGLCGT